MEIVGSATIPTYQDNSPQSDVPILNFNEYKNKILKNKRGKKQMDKQYNAYKTKPNRVAVINDFPSNEDGENFEVSHVTRIMAHVYDRLSSMSNLKVPVDPTNPESELVPAYTEEQINRHTLASLIVRWNLTDTESGDLIPINEHTVYECLSAADFTHLQIKLSPVYKNFAEEMAQVGAAAKAKEKAETLPEPNTPHGEELETELEPKQTLVEVEKNG